MSQSKPDEGRTRFAYTPQPQEPKWPCWRCGKSAVKAKYRAKGQPRRRYTWAFDTLAARQQHDRMKHGG